MKERRGNAYTDGTVKILKGSKISDEADIPQGIEAGIGQFSKGIITDDILCSTFMQRIA